VEARLRDGGCGRPVSAEGLNVSLEETHWPGGIGERENTSYFFY